jgi:hypothetical protein
VARDCSFHCWRERRRIENGMSDRTLIGYRKTDDLGFFDGALRGVLCRGNNEVADSAALQFGRAFHNGECVRSDAGFKARGSGRFFWHHVASLSETSVRQLTGQFKRFLRNLAFT